MSRQPVWRILAVVGVMCVLGTPSVDAQEFAVVGARLVNEDDAGPSPAVTIVVSAGRIVSIDSTTVDLDPSIARLDARGLFVAPGRVEVLDPLPEANSFAWRGEMLVHLSRGATTLLVPAAGMEYASRLLPTDYPVPQLVPFREADGDRLANTSGRHLSEGSVASFSILETDSMADPSASRSPVAVVVEGSVHSRDDLAREARILSYEGQLSLYELPITRLLGREGRAPWPRSCVSDGDGRCLGPDPSCALKVELWMRQNHGGTCLSPRASELRQQQIHLLEQLTKVAPADEWIVGHRVRLALIERDIDDALQAAESCAAADWWCHALRGLALHAQAPSSGGWALDSALASMPAEAPAWRGRPLPEAGDRGARCEWSDLAYLIVDSTLRADYAYGLCGDRPEYENRFWWLADPLWSEAGNPRRDEHLARNIEAKFLDEVLSVSPRYPNWMHGHCDVPLAEWVNEATRDDVRCRSSHAAWVRFGPPDSWRGVAYTAYGGFNYGPDGKLITPDGERCQNIGSDWMCVDRTEGQLREAFLSGGYSFVPTSRALLSPDASRPSDWEVTLGEGHERMVTAETWYNLDQQTAVLRRGDSLRVLSAGAFPTLLPSLDELDATLALGRVADREVLLHAADVDRITGVLRAVAMIEDTGWVVSLEASAPGVRGRSRQGAIAPVLVDGFGISKPVFVREDFDPQTDDLLEAMVPSNTLPGSGSTGMYIELYGVEAGQQVRMTLSYELGEVRRSFVGRIASALGIGGGPSGPVTVEWTEQLETVREGVGSIFVAADLGDLPTGEVELSLTASLEGQSASSSTNVQSR